MTGITCRIVGMHWWREGRESDVSRDEEKPSLMTRRQSNKAESQASLSRRVNANVNVRERSRLISDVVGFIVLALSVPSPTNANGAQYTGMRELPAAGRDSMRRSIARRRTSATPLCVGVTFVVDHRRDQHDRLLRENRPARLESNTAPLCMPRGLPLPDAADRWPTIREAAIGPSLIIRIGSEMVRRGRGETDRAAQLSILCENPCDRPRASRVCIREKLARRHEAE
jgi:hypothetical protein